MLCKRYSQQNQNNSQNPYTPKSLSHILVLITMRNQIFNKKAKTKATKGLQILNGIL